MVSNNNPIQRDQLEMVKVYAKHKETIERVFADAKEKPVCVG